MVDGFAGRKQTSSSFRGFRWTLNGRRKQTTERHIFNVITTAGGESKRKAGNQRKVNGKAKIHNASVMTVAENKTTAKKIHGKKQKI